MINRTTAKLALLLAWVLARRPSSEPPRSDRPLVAPIVRAVVKHPFVAIAAVAMVAAIAGVIVVASGVIPIKASPGHWRITAAVLDFAKVRSVKTHSIGVRPPFSLDDPALILRGAGHYESGCYPCHGRPGSRVPPVMAAMTPPPPELTARIRRWRPQDLFSIVKHGIKFTGMPAWPAQQRDDEVWAVVAFLQRLPGLDAAAYRDLVYGSPGHPNAAAALGTPPALLSAAPRAVQEICSRCHSQDGTGRGPGAFPSLAGQRAVYMHASLRAFAGRRRSSGIMAAIATTLGDQTMREVAEYYERLPSRSTGDVVDSGARARGQKIADYGIPERDIPSCADCHGPVTTPKNPAYPVLAGQHVRYLRLQLELFQQRRRGGSGFENLMQVFVERLRADEIQDVTLYYSSLQRSDTP